MFPKSSACSVSSTAIHSDAVYGREEFVERTDLGDGGFRSARRNGLRAFYLHSRCFVFGRDWQEYVAQQSTDAPGPKQGTVPECVQQKLPFPDDDEDEDGDGDDD
jgi:hypothetical protein